MTLIEFINQTEHLPRDTEIQVRYEGLIEEYEPIKEIRIDSFVNVNSKKVTKYQITLL